MPSVSEELRWLEKQQQPIRLEEGQIRHTYTSCVYTVLFESTYYYNTCRNTLRHTHTFINHIAEAATTQGADLLIRSNTAISIQSTPKNWMMMPHDVFLPKSFTMVASDCRGTTLLFKGVFVALGSRIIPEDTDISNHIFL